MNRHFALRRIEVIPIAILVLTLVGYSTIPLTRSAPSSLAQNFNKIQAGAQPQNGIVQIDEAVGLLVSDAGTAERRYGKAGEWLAAGSSLTTEAKGSARLHFVDGTVVRLGANTHLVVTGTSSDGFVKRLQMFAGDLWAMLAGGELQVKSPVGVASVRGSYIHISFTSQNQTYTAECFEGQCTLSTNAGTTNLTSGQKCSTTGGDQPCPPRQMTREELMAFINQLPESQTILATVGPILTAAPSATQPRGGQGTVPGGGQTISGNTIGGALNVGSANVSFGRGTCVVMCSAMSTLDPVAINSRPPGGGTLLAGLNVQVIPPADVVDVPLLNINFQAPSGPVVVGANSQVANIVIMQFDTTLATPRWVALPTFVDPNTGRLYTNARLLARNFALFRL